MKFRYDTSHTWFKGNVHLHSTASDGGKTFAELADLYASGGYHFLFRTDHWVLSDVAADPQTYPLLWLDGVEFDGRDAADAYAHVVCLGKVTGVTRETGFVEALRMARQQGALLILAHPHWSGNTLEDCLRGEFDGVEVYNHVCRWLNGKSDGLVYWDHALMARPQTLALAVDDAHLRPEHPGWHGGWIMVNADSCDRPAILEAITRGNFYSSCGPEIRSLSWDGATLHVSASPIQFLRLVGPRWSGSRLGAFDGTTFTEADVQIPQEWPYAYMEIEDAQGRRAWTNSLFQT